MSKAYLFTFPCAACKQAEKEGLYNDIELKYNLLHYNVSEEEHRSGLLDIWHTHAYGLAPTVFLPNSVEEKCFWIDLNGVRNLARKCRKWATKKGVKRWVSKPVDGNLDLRYYDNKKEKGGV